MGCLGVYGMMAFTVSQREREVGIRMALGASLSGVMKMVFRVLAAIAGASLIESLLFEVTAYDPAVFGTIVVILAAVAAFACWLPARRATKVDPLVGLRAE